MIQNWNREEMLNFQYGAFLVSPEHVSRIILHATEYMELKKMSKNPVREVVRMCRNHVVLLENKCIAREVVRHTLVEAYLRNASFESCFNL